MTRNKVWIYAVTLFVLVVAILTTQVTWLLESARLEESYLNQRVNMALCSAMDILSKDEKLCSNLDNCVKGAHGTFEIMFAQQEKQKIDSVIARHLRYYNINVPFQTTLYPYHADLFDSTLQMSQALLYPPEEGTQNVLVHIEIPGKNELIRSQINSTFILSIVMLIVLIGVFVNAIRSIIRERKIRKETVDFINTMAHDLKTPISNISFAVSLLSRDENLKGHPHQEFVSIIASETIRLKERARKILGMASVDAVLDQPAEIVEIDIHELIDQSISSFSMRLAEANSTIRTHLEASCSMVKGNPLQLSSAVMNIIDNAITYSDHGSSIQVRTRNSDDGISIEIEDNGPGIAIREQELVFRKAYRVRNGRTLPEGFGLGLYLAKTFVEKHGGKLSLSSDGNSGSCFVIQLPLT